MAEKKKSKDDGENDSLDCPHGHKKSMSFITGNTNDKLSRTVIRMARRMGNNVKIAVCSECGLVLNYIHMQDPEK